VARQAPPGYPTKKQAAEFGGDCYLCEGRLNLSSTTAVFKDRQQPAAVERKTPLDAGMDIS
jgi:hypothetical protein